MKHWSQESFAIPYVSGPTHFLRCFSVLFSKNNSYLTSTNSFVVHPLLCLSCIFRMAILNKSKPSWFPKNSDHINTKIIKS